MTKEEGRLIMKAKGMGVWEDLTQTQTSVRVRDRYWTSRSLVEEGLLWSKDGQTHNGTAVKEHLKAYKKMTPEVRD